MKLFWVESDHRSDGWLIVAKNLQRSREIHENLHGYSSGASRATFVSDIPEDLGAAEGYPSRQILEWCPVKITIWESPHVVEIVDPRDG